MAKLKYASVCSGIEAATVAWHPLGWKPVWFSQYDPENDYSKRLDFPSEVLQHHYPHVLNLGDMLKLRDLKTYHDEQFDLLVGGTPCQSFSIAGLRKGLGDERGNLALEFVRILIEKRPKWFVWENVPGVITSGTDENGDESDEESEEEGSSSDFACILSAFTGRDIAAQDFEKSGAIEGEFYSIAWRILDSQYFGVPQRRRRIFVVGHLGKDWRPPVAVLFEQDSLRRDFTPGGKKRKGTPGNSKNSVGGDSERVGRQSRPAELASTLNCAYGDKMGLENQHINSGAPLFVPLQVEVGFRQRGFGDYTASDTASALKKRDYKDATDLVVSTPAYGIQSVAIGRQPENGGNGMGIKVEQSPTLTKVDRHAVCHVIFDTTQVTSPTNGSNPQPGDPCHPLVKNGHVPLLVSQPIILDDQDGSVMSVYENGITGTLRAQAHGHEPIIVQESPLAFGWQNSHQQGDSVGNVTPTLDKSKTPAVIYKTLVRRLTPLECERLQGFPDNYTDIPGASDSKRYAALGNSMTTHVMQFIGKRIDMVHAALEQIKTINQ